MAALLKLIWLKRNDWVITSLVLLLLAVSLVSVSLILVLLVVLATLLTFKALLHADQCLL